MTEICVHQSQGKSRCACATVGRRTVRLCRRCGALLPWRGERSAARVVSQMRDRSVYVHSCTLTYLAVRAWWNTRHDREHGSNCACTRARDGYALVTWLCLPCKTMQLSWFPLLFCALECVCTWTSIVLQPTTGPALLNRVSIKNLSTVRAYRPAQDAFYRTKNVHEFYPPKKKKKQRVSLFLNS